MKKKAEYWKSIKPIMLRCLHDSKEIELLVEPTLEGEIYYNKIAIIFNKQKIWAYFGQKEKASKTIQEFYLIDNESKGYENLIEIIEKNSKTELIKENDEHWFMYFPEDWIDMYNNETKEVQESEMGDKEELEIYKELLKVKMKKNIWGTAKDLELYLRLHEEKGITKKAEDL